MCVNRGEAKIQVVFGVVANVRVCLPGRGCLGGARSFFAASRLRSVEDSGLCGLARFCASRVSGH
eukprot:8733305-Lingulodinium_polyedra.AAC.1